MIKLRRGFTQHFGLIPVNVDADWSLYWALVMGMRMQDQGLTRQQMLHYPRSKVHKDTVVDMRCLAEITAAEMWEEAEYMRQEEASRETMTIEDEE